jgi:hypothetical protein
MKRGKKSIGNLKQMTQERERKMRRVVRSDMWFRTGSSGGMRSFS